MSLYQTKPAMDPLERERVEIEKRRLRNIERAKRILHPKTRIMGIDTNALSEQVKSKQEAERLEIERNVFYDEMTVRHAKMANEHANRKEIERRKEHQEIEFFRLQQIAEKKARLAAEQKALALPELETKFLDFDGVDPDIQQRKRLQQMQMKDWLSQQIDHLRNKEDREAQEAAVYHREQARIVEVKGQMEAQAAKTRREEQERSLHVNRQLAMEKRQREQNLKQIEKKQEEDELRRTLTSDLLTEAVRQRAAGGSKHIFADTLPYAFKGFSTDQRQAILDEQHQQILAAQAKRQQEQDDDDRYNAQQEKIRRELLLRERQQIQQKAQERTALESTRQVQKKDQTLRSNYLKNVVYQNPVHDDFFGQFGTSCR